MPTFKEIIRSNYGRLSPSYRRVADFLLDNYHEVAFMTATQLAHRVGVDTTTVVHFAQRLGYDGYPELLEEIRHTVRAEMQRLLAEVPPTANRGKEELLERITVNPKVMVGKPVIRGTRLTVEYILGLLAHGATMEEILQEYKGLTQEDIQACLLFAAKSMESMTFMPLVETA